LVHLKESSDQYALNVVDGQQRLLTLKMILSILGLDGSGVNPTNSENPLTAAFNALRHRLGAWPSDIRASLSTFITDRCQMVRVVTNDVDEAFRVFDSQNYRGKALAPHDLLKAHHLREMRGDSDAMMAAVVEAWESISDSDLDRLFSTFLYRIARWTRGETAPGFTTKDIGMFKGIPHPESRTPHARYHTTWRRRLRCPCSARGLRPSRTPTRATCLAPDSSSTLRFPLGGPSSRW